jgi:hypothetical protein
MKVGDLVQGYGDLGIVLKLKKYSVLVLWIDGDQHWARRDKMEVVNESR